MTRPTPGATVSATDSPAGPPRCTYCGREYRDARGCDWLDGDPKPPTYGSECHPLSTGPTCYDCGTPETVSTIRTAWRPSAWTVTASGIPACRATKTSSS